MRRKIVSSSAISSATSDCAHFARTVVFGSVIMKKMNSWYIGPVIGAISLRTGWPMMLARTTARIRNDAT